MELVSRINVPDGDKTRRICLYHGDLTELPPDHAVDILLVSAFPNDYAPTPGSLIGALHQAGLSLSELSANKAADLRLTNGFWLSQRLDDRHGGLNVARVLCFEPGQLGSPPEVVSYLFRGLFPFLNEDDATIAMPLVAVGDQGWEVNEVLPPLLEAAVAWLGRGLPVQELKIVERSAHVLEPAKKVFDQFAASSPHIDQPDGEKAYDVFISYSIKDQPAAECFASALRARRPQAKIFDFRNSIDKGLSYQQEIDNAIERCRRIVAILSPDYFMSPECTEELMMARLRNKRADRGVLLPVYWRGLDGDLALWLRALNYSDCREEDTAKLADAARHEGPHA